MFTGMIDHDVPHHLRGRRNKVGPTLPDRLGVINQPQVGFVENGGRLKSMALPLPAHVMVGEPVQFRMHQREQLPQRSLVSAAPLAKQLGGCLLRGSGRRHEGFSPPQIVSRSRDFYSTTGGNRKKTAQSWRVLRGLFAYPHEPAHTTNPPLQSRNRPNLRETTAMKTVITSNSSLLTIFRLRSTFILIALTLMAFVLAQKTQALNPPPDGGYAGGNTAEGQGALLNLTSGTFNTAVGLFSLRSNMQGTFNTALGAGALFTNTADQNTATGAAALFSNTVGSLNTANGAFALFSNSEGTNNNAFGNAA